MRNENPTGRRSPKECLTAQRELYRPTLLLLICLATGLLAMPTAALAQDDVCRPAADMTIKNADQSTLSLHTECPAPGLRKYVLTLACPDGKPCDRMTVEQDVEYAPTGDAALIDLDGDGMHELQVSGMCGAGPNCEGDVYRINPATHKLYHFFSGGFADLQVIDGYLVEGGRASCCAWEFHGWRLSDDGARLRDAGNMDLMVDISASGDSEGNITAVQCTFSGPGAGGDSWQVIAPPSPLWLQICEHYGEHYQLTPPTEPAPATH